MSTRTRTRSSDPLLEFVRAHRDDESRVQVAKLNAVLDWAAVNTADPAETAALLDPMEEPALHLGGPGCPVIGEYAALDLALSLGMSTDGGLAYLGKALELRYRLPRLYARVVKLEVPVWKAFRVAEHTMSLPAAGATEVDKDIAPFLHTCSWAQVDRAVDAARAKHDPDEAERRRKKAAEHRHADVHLGDANTSGTVEMTATLDLADAIDLEAALKNGAQALADLGSTETLDVRRSQALGEMGRHQLALDLLTGEITGGTGRGITLYAHLDAEHPDLPGFLDNTWSPVLVEQIRAWCQAAGTKVTVKPVVDLATDPVTEAYEPTDAIRELVRLRDHTCVFPGCTRRRVDLDHIVPFSAGGPTSAHNLAMLCRRHHRAKTHSRWRYVMLRPGLYHWTSPTGATYLVDRRPPPLRPPRPARPPRRRP
ncbi:HNH endonuclease signature motif containing protein [Nocardioides rubriscoriae]|uniref:HNH endonuclease signature motif containing protein n=1 Tax=Nocardioides rubriscoriae TaxID=642762 RepID=UPI0011DFA541|nr:HNH endonuclease signature motif containing protein [Nocardioides rubriscoriae]